VPACRQTNPNLNVDITDLLGVNRLNLGMRLGPIFATRQRHAYYYEVAPQYATAARPAYQAEGGYSGTQFAAALTRRFDRFWVGAFMRYDNLAGAAFADSPLVKTHNYLSGGLGIAWVLGQSSEMVHID
jgi:outer membrane protein